MGHGGSEVAPENLDDERDRAELRDRYYGLLQELRVVLPGVQVLVAFLLTVPFAQRFGELDDLDRGLYGAALLFTILSAIAFISPTALHRFGNRTARGQRLRVSIVMSRVGLLCLGRRARAGAPRRVPFSLRNRGHRVARRDHGCRDGHVLDHRAAPASRRRRRLSAPVSLIPSRRARPRPASIPASRADGGRSTT